MSAHRTIKLGTQTANCSKSFLKFGFRTRATALWAMERSSILSAKFDPPVARQNYSLLATAHDCETDLVILSAAYCDVTPHLKCYSWALKECQRYGEKWSKKWAHEPTFIRVSAEIPEILAHHAIPVNRELYPTWDKFLEDFLKRGQFQQ